MKKTVSAKKATAKKPEPVLTPIPGQGKYFLRSLHQEIDLFDRKIAYLEKYQVFDTPADRADAERKLQTKRASLASAARKLAADGVEFDPCELPRSFREQPEAAAHA